MPDEIPETVATYLRLRGLPPTLRRRKKFRGVDDENGPFTPGRDPHGLADVLTQFTHDSGWDSQLAQEDIMLRWTDVAGAETAQHSEPVGFVDGTLTIRCDSTAWAKNLQLMRAHVLTQIQLRHPDAGVEALRFVGPDVPSWKWGPRTVSGRGPRDTYG